MAGLLGGNRVTDEQRQANNARTSAWTVACALIVLLCYGYLFTRLYEVVHLPSPEAAASWLGVDGSMTFASGQYVESPLQVTMTSRFGGRIRREILLVGLAACFLAVYFARLPWKRPLIVGGFLALMAILYGPLATGWFLTAHLVVYLSFHPGAARVRQVGFSAAFLLFFCVFGKLASDPFSVLLVGVMASLFAWIATRYLLPISLSLLQHRQARWFRHAVSYVVPIVVWTAALYEGFGSGQWYAPAGLVLFFWQWLRLILYGIDYQDGSVPKDQRLADYLSAFLNPAVLPAWGWGVIVGQGYAYQSSRFLCRDKNAIVRSGANILLVALLYMVFGAAAFDWLLNAVRSTGLTVYPNITSMLDVHLGDHDVGTATVLVTCLLHMAQYLCRWAGIFHFLVGVWRLLGYDVAAHIHLPLLATNLSTLWSRLLFHYREFIVRVFYYPVFLRLSMLPRSARVLVATIASAGIGNWLVQPMVQPLFYKGMKLELLTSGFRSLPFFLLLSLGIFVADSWTMWRGRRRKPWGELRLPTFKGGLKLPARPQYLLVDALCAYLTIQYFMLISVFFYAPLYENATQRDFWILLLRGVGL